VAKWYEQRANNVDHFYLSSFDERIQSRTKKPVSCGNKYSIGNNQISISPNGTLCSCINYASTQSVSKASPIACLNEKILIPIVDEMSAKLYKEKSALFIQKHYNPLYSVVAQAIS
jgi:hypothetical protein